MEATFVNKDATATLKLGQARGIAMLVPARAGLVVAEYSPNAVKKTVIGVGHGDKKQIAMMVRCCCPRPASTPPTPPTRSPSRSATPTTAKARPTGWPNWQPPLGLDVLTCSHAADK